MTFCHSGQNGPKHSWELLGVSNPFITCDLSIPVFAYAFFPGTNGEPMNSKNKRPLWN